MLKFIAIFFFIFHVKSQQKLHVEVLYESLCPDSLDFITRQLHPIFREVDPYITLKLTPFGKSASLENGAQFICQHGPKECKGNKIQSCVLQHLPHSVLQVEYVNCFMRLYKKDSEGVGQECSNAVGIDINALNQCYASEVGTSLQLLAEQDTLKFKPRFVPSIIYNGVFNQQLQDQSILDFKGVLCQLLGNQPQIC